MITIIINNYKGQKFTYTMPETAIIEITSENIVIENNELFKTGLTIEVDCEDGIELEKEDLTDDQI